MADIYHRDLTDPEIHEPKGISTAEAGTVYVADGSGSGSWIEPLGFDPALIEIPVGSVVPFGGSTAPSGFALCHGQALSRTTYSDLFDVIGTTYGPGDGSTTFNVPDCRGRSIAGRDNMDSDAGRLTSAAGGVDGDTLGAAGGAQNHVLTSTELPLLSATTSTTGSHTHTLNNGTNVIGQGSTAVRAIGGANRNFDTMSIGSAGAHTHTVSYVGGGQSHSNMQPTLITNMIIFHGVI
jgi:microcystin-dependent protein